jgi:hypothetical protein
MFWASFAGIDDELRNGLTEEFANRTAHHFVSHIKRVDVDHLSGVLRDFGKRRRPGPL